MAPFLIVGFELGIDHLFGQSEGFDFLVRRECPLVERFYPTEITWVGLPEPGGRPYTRPRFASSAWKSADSG